jgi:hypothetical protein
MKLKDLLEDGGDRAMKLVNVGEGDTAGKLRKAGLMVPKTIPDTEKTNYKLTGKPITKEDQKYAKEMMSAKESHEWWIKKEAAYQRIASQYGGGLKRPK